MTTTGMAWCVLHPTAIRHLVSHSLPLLLPLLLQLLIPLLLPLSLLVLLPLPPYDTAFFFVLSFRFLPFLFLSQDITSVQYIECGRCAATGRF
jgi:hypothetical protein